MSTVLILLGAIFVAVSNFFMRKSIDGGGSTKGFLSVQLFLVFLIAILLNPVRTGHYEWSSCMLFFGLAGGIFLAGLMISLGKALELGPAALTFAILNSSSVMPALLMVVFFGVKFGFVYTLSNGIGSLLVLIGLFWAGWQTARRGNMSRWIAFAFTAFSMHVFFLVFMQWRALFINYPGENGLFLNFDADQAMNQWFMPMIFLTATLIQWVYCAKTEKRFPNAKERFYGILGGCSNGLGTFFLIRATEMATPLEHAMLFPLFSVSILIFCNLWGQWFYKEKINWRANICCVLGLFVGTIDWNAIYPR